MLETGERLRPDVLHMRRRRGVALRRGDEARFNRARPGGSRCGTRADVIADAGREHVHLPSAGSVMAVADLNSPVGSLAAMR
jgi:hypothetical protein